jgi:hypothetical protein
MLGNAGLNRTEERLKQTKRKESKKDALDSGAREAGQVRVADQEPCVTLVGKRLFGPAWLGHTFCCT